MYDYGRMSEIERMAAQYAAEQLAKQNLNYYTPPTPLYLTRNTHKKRKEQKRNERNHYVSESV